MEFVAIPLVQEPARLVILLVLKEHVAMFPIINKIVIPVRLSVKNAMVQETV